MQSAAWYQIGEWQYLPLTGELQRDTIRHRLEPRVADVLTFLVCRATETTYASAGEVFGMTESVMA